jgi:alpha-L-arabinofuranosidase
MPSIALALALLLLSPIATQRPPFTPSPEEVTISAQHLTKRPINAMQQGQFIEILCNLIPSIIAQQVMSTSFEEAPTCHVAYKAETDEPHRPWYPEGAVEVAKYSFDTTNAYNGARSRKIEITAPHARAGVSQDGFYLKQGVTYKLRLHMRSDHGVQVRASLHGGGGVMAGPLALGRAGEKWTAAEADLRATRTLDNATLTIDFEGPGTLWLDRVYLIGSDAVLGIWRPDVVAALADMHPGVIRFGGSTTEDYNWEGGIGPWDERKPFSTVWGGLEENFVGIDEFVQLCEHVGAEPLICVRWTGKTPADAAAEVEYCNGGPETHRGAMRAKNGHREPYGVKYWQIGNEVDVPAYNTTVRSFAEAMKAADSSIKLISSFPTPSLLAAAGTAFDYLAPHHYEIDDLAHEDQSFKNLQDWIAQNGGGKDIRVAVTEWNTTAGDWGLRRGMLQTLANGLSVARYLNLLRRYADLVDIGNRSNFADSFGSGFVVTGPGWTYESPAYYAQKLYSRAAGSYPLEVERSRQQTWPQQQPDISATVSGDGKQLRIYSVNATAQTMPVHFRLDGFQAPVARGIVYTLEDHEHGLTAEVMNSRDHPLRVSLSSRLAALTGRSFDFSFKPFTLTLLELKLAR